MAELSINYIKEKWSEAGFQKYFKNTGWMFFAQFTSLISFIINIWLARYLGPSNYGILSYALAFVGLFSFISTLGINEVLIRDLVKYPEKKDVLLGTTFRLYSLGGILAFVLTIISAFIFETSGIARNLILLYSTIFLFTPMYVINSYFQATVQAKRNALAQVIATIIVSIIKVYLILSGKGIIWLTFAFILDFIVIASIYIFNYYTSDLRNIKWKFETALAKKLLYTSSFLMLSGAMLYLLMKVDQVMIKFFLDETSVGLYAASVKLSEIWYFIPSIICISLFPAIINAKKISEEIYKGRLKKLYILLIGSAILISIPVTIMSSWLVNIIYGEAYAVSATILQIYVWSGLGMFLSIGINKFLLAENYLKYIFYYNSFSVLINIILNIILIKTVGLTGAAWSTLISYSLGPIFLYCLLKNKK